MPGQNDKQNTTPPAKEPTLTEKVEALEPKTVVKYLENRATEIHAANSTNIENPEVAKSNQDADTLKAAADILKNLEKASD